MSDDDFGPDAAQWAARLARWARKRHVYGLLTAALDAGEPLGPLGAQVLWIAQPALGIVVPRREIDALARVIDAPGGMAWLRAQIDAAGPEEHNERARDETGDG